MMKYKDLLERYKNGLASEEEKNIIEQDIEKYEAIEEYLLENLDDEFAELTELNKGEINTDEAIKLKKSVNKRLNKVVFTSLGLMIGFLLIVFFLISPLIDSLYYNPSRMSVGEIDKDISFDMNVITELNMPGYKSSGVHVERKGFGTYEIDYSYRNLFTNEAYKVNSKIKRGKIYPLYYDNFQIDSMFSDVKYPISPR